MDEDRREVLTELHELSLEAAVERLLELGVLDAATLSTRKEEQLRDWREGTVARLGDELEALRRQARQQRRHAGVQIAEARRQRRSSSWTSAGARRSTGAGRRARSSPKAPRRSTRRTARSARRSPRSTC
jgi:hypothetical protein